MNNKYSKSMAVIIDRPRQVSFREIELTELLPDSYVAQTTMSGISSGTDMKTWLGLQPAESLYYPCVPGYENVGRIVHACPEAKGFAPGDRVMINECRFFGNVCAAWGGNSEYVVKNSITAPSPFDYMVKIPDNVSDQDAVLAYLPCVALKGIKRLNLRDGETVVVIGAGMVGLSALQILKILKPELKTICIERSEYRRNLATKYADHVLSLDNAEKELSAITKGKKADKLIECSGSTDMIGQLHRYIKDGGWAYDDEPAHIHWQADYPGRIVMDAYNFWFTKNCTITMTCALGPGCKEQILAWMSEGKFDTSGFPVEVWPVSKCAEAYAYKEQRGTDVFKIVFDWKN
jgi:2-desacetyl-2-hydroxyethyl bacteriochlorophyllide A dehydrogenase